MWKVFRCDTTALVSRLLISFILMQTFRNALTVPSCLGLR
jgi:hypothetical protein